ncbi:hypothetical protein FBUS_09883 [Fasciolopsis buskii]|uniref:Uncharacterized protein n=1 Tax=Fasciolopsis buskii TaxID=27845 RepID=A0A8E0VLJ5_9TREM|nr:hypothetical protein FBUS_09883 [Fasciolopsis buski]
MIQQRGSLTEDETSETVLEMVVGITVRYTIDSAIDDEIGSMGEPIRIDVNEVIKNEDDDTVIERHYEVDPRDVIKEDGNGTDFKVLMPSGETMFTRINLRTAHDCGSLEKKSIQDKSNAPNEGGQLALVSSEPSILDRIMSWLTAIRDQFLRAIGSIFGFQ